MLTADECLDRATGWERQASTCVDVKLRAEIAGIAEIWRYIARQAQWQDAFTQAYPT